MSDAFTGAAVPPPGESGSDRGADEATVREALASFRAEIRGRYNDYEISDAEDALARLVTRLREAERQAQAGGSAAARKGSEAVLPADTVCACLDVTGSRQVRVYERCERCGALMESDALKDAEWDASEHARLAYEGNEREKKLEQRLAFFGCDCEDPTFCSRPCALVGSTATRGTAEQSPPKDPALTAAEAALEHTRKMLYEIDSLVRLSGFLSDRGRAVISGYKLAASIEEVLAGDALTGDGAEPSPPKSDVPGRGSE